jgi:hypothetical protein
MEQLRANFEDKISAEKVQEKLECFRQGRRCVDEFITKLQSLMQQANMIPGTVGSAEKI